MEYVRYCMRGHEWMDCTCYEPSSEHDDESECCYMEVIHYPTCSCIGVYCEDTEETIRIQCALCREGSYVTQIIGGYLNSIDGAASIEDKIGQLGALFRYIYTVEDFLIQHLSFTYCLYEKCKELEADPKCASILTDIRAVKRLIERL